MVALFLDRLRGATRILPRLDLLLDPLYGVIVERPGLLDEGADERLVSLTRRVSAFIIKNAQIAGVVRT